MITFFQKLLVYLIGLIAAALFTWPVALLMLFFFADINGGIPIIAKTAENETTEHV